ncbi:MAG: hypothetical protein M1821_009848 [Bathelium mastoideum]|nr:MAG: hypothetical protein M1821_009848 [Bathelium mastoideum]KAI9690393.1 MAG: hypothetical protein M1822_009356 [Bathelium mastoideum]
MAGSKHATTSLLTEHFRYTPITLLDDIINTVNELVYRAVNAVEEGLLSAPPTVLGFQQRARDENRAPDLDSDGTELYPEAKTEIEEGVHQLETLLEATVDKNFDKLEIWALRNVLTVPDDLAPWVRLEHYRDHVFDQQIEAPTAEAIYQLRRKLNETRKLNAALHAESQRNALLISQLRELTASPLSSDTRYTVSSLSDGSIPLNDTLQRRNPFAFLTATPGARNLGLIASNPTSASHQPLTTNTNFALSQLPALRFLITQLQPKLAAIQASYDYENGSNTLADERKAYVEGRTRRILESRGVDLQAGDRPGRRVGEEELRGLEEIVGEIGRRQEEDEMQG